MERLEMTCESIEAESGGIDSMEGEDCLGRGIL